MSKKQNVNEIPKVESPKVRTIQEVQAEYQKVALELGDAVHRLGDLPNRIERMKNRLRDLDLEGELAFKVFEIEQRRAAEEARVKAEAEMKKPANPKGD